MDDSNKKWSSRKPPLPVDRLRCENNASMINPLMRALVLQIEEEHKVKGKWCHNYTEALALHILTNLDSWRPSKKKKKPWPDSSFGNLSPLHTIARGIAAVVMYALKVEGQWSNEYNEALIQLAIAKLRSSSSSSSPSNNININNNNNPLALHVATAS